MPDFKNAHILIVDDQPINLAGLKKIILKDNSARISMASSGKEALEIIKRDQPDLVLTDILMPEMDGFELCRRIKNDPATVAVPILFITSLNDPESIERGFDCGGIDYILKPFNPREVRSRVMAHIGLKLSADKVKSLSAWKDRLISILSHDMRGPFGNLLMFTDLFEREMGQTSDFFSDNFKKIKHSLGSVADLMENLLEWANTQRSGAVIKAERFSITKLIDECVAAHSSYAADKKITLNSNFSAAEEFTADRHVASIILRNLVRNAIKFTDTGSVTIDAMASDDALKISISDTGVGMEASVLSAIFERGESFSTLGTIKEKGSGTGLMICMDLAERCGWKLTAESEPGRGSKFSFVVPRVREYGNGPA